jgi:MraZ protein
MFRGHCHHTIDQKGRISFPARFREILEASGNPRMVMTPALFDGCLDVYPVAAWEEVERELVSKKSLDPDEVRYQRLYVSRAVDVELDKTGRVLVPQELRQAVRLEHEVLWVGSLTKVELWSKAGWERYVAQSPEEYEAFRRSVQERYRQ